MLHQARENALSICLGAALALMLVGGPAAAQSE